MHSFVARVYWGAVFTFVVEGFLLFFWAVLGIVICAHGHAVDALIVDHVLGSLHFVVTFALCAMVERYYEIKSFRKGTSAKPPDPEWLLSWALPVFISLCVDAYMLTRVKEIGHGIEKAEFVFGVWALINSAWSMAFFAVLFLQCRRIKRKKVTHLMRQSE